MSKGDLIKQELEALAEANNGILRPEIVVEWDDTEAAKQYRLWQARQIIKVAINVLPAEPEIEYQGYSKENLC